MPLLTPTDPHDPMQQSITVYISIGNTDGKLSPAEWAAFYRATGETIARRSIRMHGAWHSIPATPYSNACWAVDVYLFEVRLFKDELRQLAARFRQDSIAWAPATTEFLTPTE
jgi:hypothetical protein